MTEETRPKRADDDVLTPELAKTERAPSKDAPTRTGPRTTVGTGAPPPRTVGRFRIDAQLGSGGMGDVFRAYDPVLDRAVALKVLRSDHSADAAQRMRRVVREARAAAALTHPNTVTIFEVGEADREVFIAMELLEGEDLRAVLERGGASIADKLRWLLEAARALGAAHDRGLVHRDVKPENMFVCTGGTLKLLAFGIAKRDDEDGASPDAAVDLGPSSLRTTEGRRIGTPRYMAPEQHAGDATDPRTDEYAWGLVAFELLSGAHVVADLRTKTTDGSDAAPVPALAAQRLEVLRASAPEVSEDVLLTIGRALEPRKEDRFPSMAPIIVALEAKTEPKPGPKSEPKREPTPEPRRTRSWLVLPAIGLAVAAGMYGLRVATHATSASNAAGAGTTAACT
ncbi:MAG: eukaryotic-like serine/threonine-protein kinase, partial [Myxococcales bacterium]|nr:eukaryotic-like serine/threonine-protein kinase [Myxococcales bacterium]